MANLLINQGTNSAINFDLSGTVNTQVVAIGYGTLSTLGTLPNLPGGSIVVTAATISAMPNIPGGSVVQTAGTVNTGTINTGTINLGTVVGKDANAAAQTGNPVAVGGTDSGGTVRTIKVDSGGLQRVGLDSGTVSVLPNLPGGSIVMTAGTIATGSIVVTAGTVNTGTINTGTINAGTINLGTVVGKDANAAAQTGNPLAIGGTDSGGTVRTIKVDSGGLQRIGLDSGTITVLPNLPGGSIVQTAGTLNTGTINTGTMVAQPYPASQVLSAGTTSTGTIGTLVVAAGAGTGIYINSLVINANSGTPEVLVSFGLVTSGNQVVNRGIYALGAGIAMPYPAPSYYGTANSALTFNILSGSGTVSYAVTYNVKGTP